MQDKPLSPLIFLFTMKETLMFTMICFLEDMYDVENSMMTTRMYDIKEGEREGRVQLKWDKESATMYIKNIFLAPYGGTKNKYVIDQASKDMLRMFRVMDAVIVECPKPFLVAKYKPLGWDYDEDTNQLLLEHPY
jgi:hypothetical protein